MTMTFKERRLLLADWLERDAANPNGMKFDLTEYLTYRRDTKPGLDCGTSCCALGLATFIPEFNAEGFKLDPSPHGSFDDSMKMLMAPLYREDTINYYGFDAAEKFFGLTTYGAHYIFDTGHYSVCQGADAELAVAKRLREIDDHADAAECLTD